MCKIITAIPILGPSQFPGHLNAPCHIEYRNFSITRLSQLSDYSEYPNILLMCKIIITIPVLPPCRFPDHRDSPGHVDSPIITITRSYRLFEHFICVKIIIPIPVPRSSRFSDHLDYPTVSFTKPPPLPNL